MADGLISILLGNENIENNENENCWELIYSQKEKNKLEVEGIKSNCK